MWRLWYADGSTVTSDDCAPEVVPGYGVQAIAQPDRTVGTGNVGYTVTARFDWYAWRTDTGEWFGMMGDASVWDQILHREPIVGVCQGRRIATDRYEEILAEAQKWAAEQGLPVKSGRRLDETS